MGEDPLTPSITQIYRDRNITFESIVAEDDVSKAVITQAKKAANTNASILIVGESGTGKNLLAQAIHNHSPRSNKSFVASNCAGFADSLIESELFGHEKGAFTGADRVKKGVFEQADGGTLFLDEVGDLSNTAQAKMLRTVEYKEFERVGGEETRRTDIRIIFATLRDLDEAVKNKEFREDLLYRINEFKIEIPPLRNRKKDIPILAERCLGEFNAAFGYGLKGFSDDAARALLGFDWPGNARRLRAVIKRACAMAEGEQIELGDLELSANIGTSDPDPDSASDWSLETVERRHIESVLAHTQGNKSEAARILGIARTTLDRKIAAFGIS